MTLQPLRKTVASPCGLIYDGSMPDSSAQSGTQPASSPNPAGTGRYRYGPFVLLCVIGFAGFFCSYLRSPVLPLFAASLGAGPAQVGIVNGAFMLTAGVLSIPAGLLADRLGRRRLAVAGIAAAAASSLLVAQCATPGQMAAAYLLFGAGLAAFAPSMLSQVAESLPPERLGQAYGWYSTAIYGAMALGPATGGYLAKTLGLRPVFLISGALLLLVAALALAVLPRSPSRHRNDARTLLAASAGLRHNRQLLAGLLATLGACIGFGIFLTFLPLHAAGKGLDPAQVGLVFAAQALTNVVSRVPIGLLADRVERRVIVVAGLLALAAGLALIGAAGRLVPLLSWAVLLGTGMALTFTAIGALVAEAVPAPQRGLAMGMYNSCIYLGMMAGSSLLGVVIRAVGYPTGFLAGGGIALATLAPFLVLMRPRQTDQGR